MQPARHPPLFVFAACALGIALFSGMDAVMKGMVLAIGTFATMLWRNLAGLVMSATLYLPGRERWPTREVMKIHIVRGVLSTAMGYLFFWGIARVPLAQAIALAFISPVIALYLASLILHEQIGPRTIAGSLLAVGGMAIIFFGQSHADLGPMALMGSLAIVGSAALYAMNIILMRRQSLVAKPVEITFFQNLTVTGLLVLVALFVGADLPQARHWPWLLFAAALALASMLLLSWAYARAQASYLAATEYTAFLWAALFGWLVFGEPLAVLTICGAALIVCGCFVAARKPEDASPALEAGP
ncbi:MAG: DMT family transporter [Sphingomicrobium sp.]